MQGRVRKREGLVGRHARKEWQGEGAKDQGVPGGDQSAGEREGRGETSGEGENKEGQQYRPRHVPSKKAKQ